MADITTTHVGPPELVYIEKVRQAMRRLSSHEPDPDNIRSAAQAVRDLSTFDVEVPTASRRREFELVKVGLKRLMVWYMRYLAGQLNAFGANVSRLGESLVARTEKLETTTDDLSARVGAAEERLARLEAAAPGDALPVGEDEPKPDGDGSSTNSQAPRRQSGATRGTNRPRNNRRKSGGS